MSDLPTIEPLTRDWHDPLTVLPEWQTECGSEDLEFVTADGTVASGFYQYEYGLWMQRVEGLGVDHETYTPVTIVFWRYARRVVARAMLEAAQPPYIDSQGVFHTVPADWTLVSDTDYEMTDVSSAAVTLLERRLEREEGEQ